MKKTVYCLTPQDAESVFINTDKGTVYAITPACEKKIKVQLDKESFRNRHCDTCNFRIDSNQLRDKMKAAKVMSSTLNKLSFCQQNNLCTSSDQMLALCPAGHNLTDFEYITISVPKLLWVYNFNLSGKELFKLYAVEDEQGLDLTVRPYLLSNVYTNPKACISWPKNQSRPTNLRQAYNTYWESPFSEESWVVRPNMTYIEHLNTYDVFSTEEEPDYLLNFKTRNIQLDMTNSDGVFYSSDEKLINSIPKRFRDSDNHLLGSIQLGASNNWLFKINDHLFTKNGKLSGTAKLNVIA